MADDPTTRQFERHVRQLQEWTGTPTEPQIAACTALEGLIDTAQATEAYFLALRLRALWHLGKFLLRVRRGKGRPRKNEPLAHLLKKTYEQLGIAKPHIARNALTVAQVVVSEAVLYRFLATQPKLTMADLLRYAKKHGYKSTDGFWLLPPEWIEGLQLRYGKLVDLFPNPRKEGWDALSADWLEIKAQNPDAALLVHPPFLKSDYDEGQSLVDVVRKCIHEASKGVGPILLVMPTRFSVNLLAEAPIEITQMRSMGRPRFRHTSTGETHKSPPPVTFFELNPKPKPVPTIGWEIDLSDADRDSGEAWLGQVVKFLADYQ